MKIDVLKLDALQRTSGMNCLKLAKKTGLSHATISAIRTRGSAQPMTIRRLAEALGVDLADLTANEPHESGRKSRV